MGDEDMETLLRQAPIVAAMMSMMVTLALFLAAIGPSEPGSYERYDTAPAGSALAGMSILAAAVTFRIYRSQDEALSELVVAILVVFAAAAVYFLVAGWVQG